MALLTFQFHILHILCIITVVTYCILETEYEQESCQMKPKCRPAGITKAFCLFSSSPIIPLLCAYALSHLFVTFSLSHGVMQSFHFHITGQIELSFSIRSSMYDITDSYYKCNLTRGSCRLKIHFPGGNDAVLNTPGPEEVRALFSWLH